MIIYQGVARIDSLAKSYDQLDFGSQLLRHPLKLHPYLYILALVSLNDTIFLPFQFYCMELYLVELDCSPTRDPKSSLLSILQLIEHYFHYSFHCKCERRDCMKIFEDSKNERYFFCGKNKVLIINIITTIVHVLLSSTSLLKYREELMIVSHIENPWSACYIGDDQ